MSEENNLIERPSFLPSVTEVDNNDMNLFSKPPRLKIVQAQTKPPVKPPFAEGDAVILPQLKKIGDNENAFTFVVVGFFPSWICLNPLKATHLKSIREFSLDPNSEVAKKCKAFVKEPCPEMTSEQLKYSETLNFFVMIEDNPEFADIPVHMFFSRGSYAVGQALIGEIQLRKAPRYACRFRAGTHEVTNKSGEAYQVLVIENDPQPWVDEDRYKKYEKLHTDLKTVIDNKAVELDLEDFGKQTSDDDTATTSEF